MGKIDNQMLSLYRQYTTCESQDGKQISPDEAYSLLRRADQINCLQTNSCFNSSSKKGSKDLEKLVKENPDNFSPSARNMIANFCNQGRMPSPQERQAYAMASNFPLPGNQSLGDVSEKSEHAPIVLVDPLPSGGRPPLPAPPLANTFARVPLSPSTYDMPASPGPAGGRASFSPSIAGMPNVPARPNIMPAPSPVLPNIPAPTPAPSIAAPSIPAPSIPAPSIPVSQPRTPGGPYFLDFVAKNPVWYGHWWPQKENAPGGSPDNNLYAIGGPLDKLDKLTHKGAREYEFAHFRKSMASGNKYGWWGKCNDAAQAACIFREPKRSVTMNGITFTPRDIQGLLVMMSSSLITKVDFKGQRFNDASRDDPSDPKPALFLQTIGEWSKDGMPFVFDIDKKEMVWNYPFDRVLIKESMQAPAGFNHLGDGTKYYDIRASGTGYPKQARNLSCYIKYDNSGNIVSQGWINTNNANDNPDFMWRPHPVGDIYNKANWQLRQDAKNPNIDPQLIYDIYMQSIA